MKYDNLRLIEIEKAIRNKESKKESSIKKEASLDDHRIRLLAMINYLAEKIVRSRRTNTFFLFLQELSLKEMELNNFLKENYSLDIMQHRCYPRSRDYEIDYTGRLVSYQDEDDDDFSLCYCYDCHKEFLSNSEFPICQYCNSSDTYYCEGNLEIRDVSRVRGGYL